MSIRRSQAGDTIIEVLLAITIFSLVTVGSLTLMNKGSATAQRALEITAVRHQIDNQAELLRYVHNAYLSNSSASTAEAMVWSEIKDNTNTGITIGQIDVSGGQCPDLSANQPFILSASTTPNEVKLIGLTAANFTNDPASFAQFRPAAVGGIPKSEGLWIEAVNGVAGSGGYIDFYIRSCWQTIGQKVPMTIQTIVRLYDPAQDN